MYFLFFFFSFSVFLIAYINKNPTQKKSKKMHTNSEIRHILIYTYVPYYTQSNMINDDLNNHKFSIRRFVGWRRRRQWISREDEKAKENKTNVEVEGCQKKKSLLSVFVVA